MNFLSARIAYADLDTVIGKIDTLIINPLISFLFALAILFFLYGVLEFFMNQENEEAKTTGKQHMIWGVIGIAIMMGVWTILGVITKTLGIDDEVRIENTNNSGSIEVDFRE